MFEHIQERRNAVEENIAKSFGETLEKAHAVGDISPDGKMVWTEYAPGKFDWHVRKKKEKTKLDIVSVAVYIFAKNEKGETFVLAGKRGSSAPTGANKMNPPMGMIDWGESPVEAAVREIEEETGLKIKKEDLVDRGDEEYKNRKGTGGKNYTVLLSGKISDYVIGEGDGENSKFSWVKVSSIKDDDWAFGTGNTAKKLHKK